MQLFSGKTIWIIGKVFTPALKEELQTLHISDGKIVSILPGRHVPEDQDNGTVIELSDNQVVFPGFINLHTHIGYNILPIWDTEPIWTSRHQWRKNDRYRVEIRGLITYIQSNWRKDAAPEFVTQLQTALVNVTTLQPFEKGFSTEAFLESATSELEKAHIITSEIQAIAGGTAIIQHTKNLDSDEPNQRTFIIRNTENAVDLGVPGNKKIQSVVDLYVPTIDATGNPNEDTSKWIPKADPKLTDFINGVNNNNQLTQSTLAHIGEGKAGLFKNNNADPYSRLEIRTLVTKLQQSIHDPNNIPSANLAITHGSGIDTDDQEQLDFLLRNNISVVWSPVSNFLLYGDTINVPKLIARGMTVSLGSDWSPSGSKHVFDELRFAQHLNEVLEWGISKEQLYAMVTTNPCKALGIENAGKISAGANADLFILDKTHPEDDPLTALFTGTDQQIAFVMVNGRIVFGLTSYFDLLEVDFTAFPGSEGEQVALRGVSINSHIAFNLDQSLQLMDLLIDRYCKEVISKPLLKRTKFLSADDAVYKDRIQRLKQQISSGIRAGQAMNR